MSAPRPCSTRPRRSPTVPDVFVAGPAPPPHALRRAAKEAAARANDVLPSQLLAPCPPRPAGVAQSDSVISGVERSPKRKKVLHGACEGQLSEEAARSMRQESTLQSTARRRKSTFDKEATSSFQDRDSLRLHSLLEEHRERLEDSGRESACMHARSLTDEGKEASAADEARVQKYAFPPSPSATFQLEDKPKGSASSAFDSGFGSSSLGRAEDMHARADSQCSAATPSSRASVEAINPLRQCLGRRPRREQKMIARFVATPAPPPALLKQAASAACMHGRLPSEVEPREIPSAMEGNCLLPGPSSTHFPCQPGHTVRESARSGRSDHLERSISGLKEDKNMSLEALGKPSTSDPSSTPISEPRLRLVSDDQFSVHRKGGVFAILQMWEHAANKDATHRFGVPSAAAPIAADAASPKAVGSVAVEPNDSIKFASASTSQGHVVHAPRFASLRKRTYRPDYVYQIELPKLETLTAEGWDDAALIEEAQLEARERQQERKRRAIRQGRKSLSS